jgi:hypothetical protein
MVSAMLLTAVSARADFSPTPLPGQPPCCNPTITLITATNFASIPGAVAGDVGDFEWSYAFEMGNGGQLNPNNVNPGFSEYAVIYEFGGYVLGSATAPAGWTITETTGTGTAGGPDPHNVPQATVNTVETTGVANLQFTDTNTTFVDQNTFFTFTAISTSGTAVLGGYGGQDFSKTTGQEQGNEASFNMLVPDGGAPVSVSTTSVGAVPEPTSVLLFGSVLVLVGLAVRRKFSAT